MSTSTSSSDDTLTSACQGEDTSSNKKVSTSCAQKVESCNKDVSLNNNTSCYSSNAFRFDVPSDNDELTIASSPSKSLFVFGGGDAGGQTSKGQKDVKDGASSDYDINTASNSSSGIDAVSDSLGKVNISNDAGKMAISDDKLFQDPPPNEDCPICMQPMPFAPGLFEVYMTYMPCCGKMLCKGCCLAEDNEIMKGNIKPWCACCRVPLPKNDKDMLKRYHKRMKLNDAAAFVMLADTYQDGDMGLPQDMNKPIELLHKAAELGSCNAHAKIATIYFKGERVEQDKKKAMSHFKLAAMGGHEVARFLLGISEDDDSNIDRAMRHFMIAARSGEDQSLKAVGEGYKAGHVSKEDYATTLRAYQSCRNEMKSKQRDIAAATHDE